MIFLWPADAATRRSMTSLPRPRPWCEGWTAMSQMYEQSTPSATARPAATSMPSSRAKNLNMLLENAVSSQPGDLLPSGASRYISESSGQSTEPVELLHWITMESSCEAWQLAGCTCAWMLHEFDAETGCCEM